MRSPSKGRETTVRRAARIQNILRGHLKLRAPASLRHPRLVAGADVSYDKRSDAIWAAVVILTFPDLEIAEVRGARGRADFPYIPGYLSFREMPILMRAFERIHAVPDFLLCDGQGIAHPRGLGLASHVGLLLGIPTIGCAKSRLVGEHGPLARARGSVQPLVYKGERVGSVLRTRDGVNPIYVSPGHLVDSRTATRLALACCRDVRLPIPTRLAHIEVNRLRLGSPVHQSQRRRRSARPPVARPAAAAQVPRRGTGGSPKWAGTRATTGG